MEKYISKFNISADINKGITNQLVICSNCNHRNFVSNKNKLTYQKIKTVMCGKCFKPIVIGEIFNFITGSKLNNRCIHYNPDNFDRYVWDNNYDNI